MILHIRNVSCRLQENQNDTKIINHLNNHHPKSLASSVSLLLISFKNKKNENPIYHQHASSNDPFKNRYYQAITQPGTQRNQRIKVIKWVCRVKDFANSTFAYKPPFYMLSLLIHLNILDFIKFSKSYIYIIIVHKYMDLLISRNKPSKLFNIVF